MSSSSTTSPPIGSGSPIPYSPILSSGAAEIIAGCENLLIKAFDIVYGSGKNKRLPEEAQRYFNLCIHQLEELIKLEREESYYWWLLSYALLESSKLERKMTSAEAILAERSGEFAAGPENILHTFLNGMNSNNNRASDESEDSTHFDQLSRSLKCARRAASLRPKDEWNYLLWSNGLVYAANYSSGSLWEKEQILIQAAEKLTIAFECANSKRSFIALEGLMNQLSVQPKMREREDNFVYMKAGEIMMLGKLDTLRKKEVWKQRWCVLNEEDLMFFKDKKSWENDVKKGEKFNTKISIPIRTIAGSSSHPCNQACNIMEKPSKKLNHSCLHISLTDTNTHDYLVEDVNEASKWATVIRFAAHSSNVIRKSKALMKDKERLELKKEDYEEEFNLIKRISKRRTIQHAPSLDFEMEKEYENRLKRYKRGHKPLQDLEKA